MTFLTLCVHSAHKVSKLLTLCVHSAHKVSKLPVFSSYCLLAFSGYFHVHLTYIYIYIKRSALLRFLSEIGGGGVMNLVYGSLFSSLMASLVFYSDE